MRKLLAFLLFACSISIPMNAKTIHWLTFIDTTDAEVGEIDKNTRTLLYSKWIEVVNAILSDNGYSVNPIDMYGKDVSPKRCKEVVSNLECGAEDIVVFYYIGHGTENNNTSQYPLMLMAQHFEKYLIPLSWVHEELKAKHPRLTISIGMCCNSSQNIVQGKTMPSFGISYGSGTIITSEQEAVIKKMFLNYKGDMIVTSSSPKERSYATIFSNLGPSDYFTLNLISQFENIKVNDSNLGWSSILQDIKNAVYSDVKSDETIQSRMPGATQTPLWDCNLTLTGAPIATQQASPRSFSATIDDDFTIKARLNNLFAYISSSKTPRSERISKAQECMKYFSDSAVVKFASQDDVVYDRNSVKQFMREISSLNRIDAVSVLSFEMDDNAKICNLTVREIVKQHKND